MCIRDSVHVGSGGPAVLRDARAADLVTGSPQPVAALVVQGEVVAEPAGLLGQRLSPLPGHVR
eukprot:10700871-Alexandrium_andersonii.AAC.1